ncbi:Sec8 exocyst complex component-specific domain-containing protein [Crucibulum laeve]|uniref:Exocyst complex component Sec8 n=1 Tax=Crucibulum laeve TaxID=68775 RepID=A0A5C3M6Y2_9AGAR|nr:Sec8 exocyst complex component-specific domain-containing protein [Crucibulum laeve]
MSRAPPFPTRRRSPSQTSGNPYATQSSSAPGNASTRPLQFSRPPSRPTTPSNSSLAPSSPGYGPPPNTAPIGPSRPQRSERRNRASEYSASERASTSSQDPYRDSVHTARSDNGLPGRNGATIPSERPKLQRLQSVPSEDGADTTPTSLTSALSAFQSAGSRRRKMTLDEEDVEYQRERENEIEAEKARQQRIREKAPGRKANGSARKGDIDAVLDQVKDGWEFVIDPDFNNVDLALQLLDESSLGKDMESFRRTKNMLSKALQGSVDKHYQAFAASLPHHASLLNHLSSSQSQISNARSALLESKDALGSKRADLVQLWSRGQTLDEMIKILDQIEHLKAVPDLLETLVSEKRLLQASVLLIRSLKIINKPDMLEIGAVSDLRSYLNGQEIALRDILVDELQSHLYLKSFWCESRWSAYTPGQTSFAKPDFEDESVVKFQGDALTSPDSATFRQSRLTRFVNDLALRLNEPPYDLTEPKYSNGENGLSPLANPPLNALARSSNLNPESDSFAYMETLLESLAVLGQLGTALDNVAQRLPSEIYSLVETTLGEVEERAEYGRRRTMFALNGGLNRSEGTYVFSSSDGISSTDPVGSLNAPLRKATSLRLAALESSSKRIDHEILKDLFWTVYSKLDAVAQGLRVVSEVANRIGSRRDFKDSSGANLGVLFPLAETWSPVQAEVRNLIQDYLTDEQQGSVTGRNPITSINEILREGRFTRDRIKAVFRFADTDMKSTNKALRPHEDGLTRVLKDTMPGLVPASSGDPIQMATLTGITEDRMLGIDHHHRLLIQPDAFHVAVLFQPTLVFLERVAEILPSGMESARASSAVLEEFVLKVYLPQLEEKVLELFHEAVSASDAFLPDPLSLNLCTEPLVKASTHLMALINSLCVMLHSSPFHRENYTRLILGVIIQFYQRCSDRYQVLTSIHTEGAGLGPSVALAAQWVQKPELQPCLSELSDSVRSSDISKLPQLCRQETNIEVELLGRKTIHKNDLIMSLRNLSALGSLYRSVAWFSTQLNSLRGRTEDLLSPTTPNNLETLSAFTPFTPGLPSLPSALSSDQLSLPLSREMALRFQALVKTYEQLSSMMLDTIRIDIRCRAVYYIDSALLQGNYCPAYDATEPDPQIGQLNAELVECDESVSTNLPEKDRQYVFLGVGNLMEHVLITHARYLRVPNAFGINKVMRNILSLQQSVKTLTHDRLNTEFGRAKEYYSLYFLSPQSMIEGIRGKRTFTFDEYQTMLNLQCGVNSAEGEAGAAKANDRNYSMYVIDLHGLEIDSTNS